MTKSNIGIMSYIYGGASDALMAIEELGVPLTGAFFQEVTSKESKYTDGVRSKINYSIGKSLIIIYTNVTVDELIILSNGDIYPDYGFQYGNLAEIYPDETLEQLIVRRENNFTIFKNLIDTYKITGSLLKIYAGRLEVYYSSGTQVNVSNSQFVNIDNSADIFIYPFIRTADSTFFNLNTGAEISIIGTGTFQHQLFPSKVEAYNAILAYGGNKSVIRLNSTPRAGFMDSIVGQVIYISPGKELPHVAGTVLSYVGNDITLTAPLVIADNLTNYFTNISYKFPSTISEADYETYGGFWWNGYAHSHYFIYCLPLVAETNPVLIRIGNDLANFTEILSISAEKFHLTFDDGVKLSKATLLLTAYGQNTYNLQSIDFDNLYFEDYGILILGGDGGASQHITDENILGSGAYIHPQMIVNGDTLHNLGGLAAMWRWYGFSGVVTQGYQNNINAVISAGQIPEYTLRTSGSETTNIDSIIGAGRYYLNRGNFPYVDVDIALMFLDSVSNATANLGEVSTYFLGAYNTTLPSILNVDEVHVKALNVLDYNTVNIDLAKTATIGSLDVLNYGSFGVFTRGTLETGSVFNGIIAPHYGLHNIVVENPNIAARAGLLFSYLVPTNFDYNSRTLIKNGSVLCSRIFSCTGYAGFFRDMLTFENVVLNSLAAGQGSSSRFANLIFRVKPVIANVSKTPVAGTLEFEFQNEVTINGGGTVRILKPYAYDSQGTKIAGSRYYVGTVTLHAVGGNIVIEGYDTYSDSNIAVSETILAGTSKTYTCNTDDVRGVLGSSLNQVTATTGAVSYTISLLPGSAVYPESVVTSFGTVTLTGSEDIASANVTGKWDKFNGTIRLDFTSAPTGNITLNYKVWGSITALGTWH